jgi:hypothetical protein
MDFFLFFVPPASSAAGLGCPAGDALTFIADNFTRVVDACASGDPTAFPPLARRITLPAGLPPTRVPGAFRSTWPAGLALGDWAVLVATTPPSALLDGLQTTDTLAVDGRAFSSLP